MKNATFGRARIIKRRCRYFIALLEKTRLSTLFEKKIVKEALRSLYDGILELNLQTISVFKTDMDNIS